MRVSHSVNYAVFTLHPNHPCFAKNQIYNSRKYIQGSLSVETHLKFQMNQCSQVSVTKEICLQSNIVSCSLSASQLDPLYFPVTPLPCTRCGIFYYFMEYSLLYYTPLHSTPHCIISSFPAYNPLSECLFNSTLLMSLFYFSPCLHFAFYRSSGDTLKDAGTQHPCVKKRGLWEIKPSEICIVSFRHHYIKYVRGRRIQYRRKKWVNCSPAENMCEEARVSSD